MHWTQRIIAIAVAIVLATGFSTSARVETSGTVTATLTGGLIAFSIEVTANLSLQRYSHETGYTNATGGSFTVNVTDDRNTATGYNILLAASDFTRVGGVGLIDLGVDGTTLAVPTAGVVTRINGDAVNLPTANTATNVTSTGVPILTAANTFGNGHYSAAGYALTLTGVSASVPTGDYRSTLTLSSSAGPQS